MFKIIKSLNIFIFVVLLFAFSGCKAAPENSSSKSASSVNESSRISSSSTSSESIQFTGSGKKIPVLMYHSIMYEKGNDARVSAETFSKQMKWLYDNGYKTLSLDELYYCLKNNTGFYEKSVVITFDDGYEDNYLSAFFVLKKYDFCAAIFMISSEINKAGYLKASQLAEMSADRISIEDHTVNHPSLNTLSYEKQLKELKDSATAIEAITGIKPMFLAYPNGKYDDNTIKALQELGYKAAFKMSGGLTDLSDTVYKLPRVYMGDSLEKFINTMS